MFLWVYPVFRNVFATMAATTQWAVVSKNTKKSKKNNQNQQNGKMSKNQLKNFIENMPTVKELTPVKESPTIFEAFLQKESVADNKQMSNKHSKTQPNNNESSTKKSNLKKKHQLEKKKEQPEKPMKNLEEAIHNIKADDLKSFMILVQERFPNTPLVWLKDLVAYLNLKLNAPTPDPLFSGKPVDYPTSIVSLEIQGLILEVFNKCPDVTLELFFEHAISDMIEDTIKGQNTNGNRMIIQCLAFSKPSLTLNNLQKFKDLQKQHQNQHAACLSLLWALGQGGIKDFSCGIRIWLEMMLPVLGLRAYSKYAVDYLDLLFSIHSDVQSCGSVLGIREFFPVMDMIFTHNANLPPVLHKKLLALYPKLKTVALGSNPDQVLRNFFPSFLLRLSSGSALLLKNELKTCLMMCLAVDKHCYSIWRQLYTKHLDQSCLLLQHLVDEWETVSSSLPKKLLKETLGTFQVTNEELAASGKAQPECYQKCVEACDILLQRMSIGAMFPRRLIFFFLIVISALLISWNIISNGSFDDSHTGKFLNKYGIVTMCNHAWGKIIAVSFIIFRWLEENVPQLVSKAYQLANPYIQLFWAYLGHFILYLMDVTSDGRAFLSQKALELLEWVNDNMPIMLEKMDSVLQDVWSMVYHFAVNLGTWLQEHVFNGKLSPENIQKCTLETVEKVQQYTVAAYQWLLHQVLTVTAGN